jgi:hypothetical protein
MAHGHRSARAPICYYAYTYYANGIAYDVYYLASPPPRRTHGRHARRHLAPRPKPAVRKAAAPTIIQKTVVAPAVSPDVGAKLARLANRVEKHHAALLKAEKAFDEHVAKIAALEATQRVLAEANEKLAARVSTLAENIASLEHERSALTVRVRTLENRVTALERTRREAAAWYQTDSLPPVGGAALGGGAVTAAGIFGIPALWRRWRGTSGIKLEPPVAQIDPLFEPRAGRPAPIPACRSNRSRAAIRQDTGRRSRRTRHLANARSITHNTCSRSREA